MSFVIASQIALWLAVLALGMVCMALARQIGVLHQRIAPAGALALRQPLKIGEPVPEMSLTALDGAAVRIGRLAAESAIRREHRGRAIGTRPYLAAAFHNGRDRHLQRRGACRFRYGVKTIHSGQSTATSLWGLR